MALEKLLNGQRVAMSPEEEAAFLANKPSGVLTPSSVTRLQLVLGLTSAGLISAAEAEAAAAGIAIPALIATVFDALPADQATIARIRFKGMTLVERRDPLVAAVASATGKSAADMDQYFRDWSVL